jgi:hypothetical protein
VSQAESDRQGAGRLYDPDDHRTYCQTIAKYQQMVEKSIKAIAAAVRDVGIVTFPLSHYYKHDVDTLISALRHLPQPKDNREIQGRINRLLGEYHRAEIKALSELAPKKPGPRALHARNNEYPYETARGVWTAPALPDAFQLQEVERFRELAERIYEGTRQIVSALRRR